MSNDAKPIRTIFMGTPDFAVPSFLALTADPRFQIVLAITQSDKAAGRGQVIQETPIKQAANSLSIPVIQPAKIKEAEEDIRKLAPELIIVVAYGKIIPKAILDIPRHGCINLHGSLLPQYRGASCLAAPILNGDSQTGITVMRMDEGMDTGPVICQEKIELKGYETLGELHERLSGLGAATLPQAIIDYIEGKIIPQAQDETLASYVKLTRKEDGLINWSEEARKIERQVRAYNPWPGAFSFLPDGKRFKILAAQAKQEEEKTSIIGQLSIENGRVSVGCGQGKLIILQLQLESGKKLDARQFAAGYARLDQQILASSSIG